MYDVVIVYVPIRGRAIGGGRDPELLDDILVELVGIKTDPVPETVPVTPLVMEVLDTMIVVALPTVVFAGIDVPTGEVDGETTPPVPEPVPVSPLVMEVLDITIVVALLTVVFATITGDVDWEITPPVPDPVLVAPLVTDMTVVSMVVPLVIVVTLSVGEAIGELYPPVWNAVL